MKKLIGAAAVCALAVGLVAVPATGAPKSEKHAQGTVTGSVTPSTVTTGGQTVTASGNVASTASCRKDRTVSLQWVDSTNTPVGSATTTMTTSNGNYSTPVTAPATVGTYTLQATVQGPVERKVGGKKKSRRGKRH